VREAEPAVAREVAVRARYLPAVVRARYLLAVAPREAGEEAPREAAPLRSEMRW
jgi:hypothetical protein